jgi:hypothetical protein
LSSSIGLNASRAEVEIRTESAGRAVEASRVSSSLASLGHQVSLAHPNLTFDVESTHQVTFGTHASRQGFSSYKVIIPAQQGVLCVGLIQFLDEFLLILVVAVISAPLGTADWGSDIKGPDQDSNGPE